MEKNIRLIGVSGKKRSGKNAVAAIINKLLQEKNIDKEYIPYEEKSFAYLVKKFASELTGIPMEGWETEEDKIKFLGPEWSCYNEHGLLVRMTRRMMLQKLGSDACNQNLHPNCWVIGLFKDYNDGSNIKDQTHFQDYLSYKNQISKWLITDVRFPQEVKAIKERDGVIIRVRRPSTEKKDAHISETALDNYDGFDFYIMNDKGLEELEEKVRHILFQLNLI